MLVLEGEKKPEPKPVEPVVEKEVTDEEAWYTLFPVLNSLKTLILVCQTLLGHSVLPMQQILT